MWSHLSYRCDVCHAYTVLGARLFRPGICDRCGSQLDLRGHPHQVCGTAASDAIRDSPVPVVLVFAAGWQSVPAEERDAVESLAHAMSGEVTVLVADIAADFVAQRAYETHGRPRAVLLSKGNELGRGTGYPQEGPIRFVLSRALPELNKERARLNA